MCKTASVCVGLGLALALSSGLAAQQAAATQSPAQVHLAHVNTKFVGVKTGGLLQAAQAEAQVVAQHAALGLQASDLAGMKTHAGHIIHAIDPRRVTTGPGTGYGLLTASEGLVRHLELASRAQGANDQLKTAATTAIAAAKNTQRRADRILGIAIIINDFVETPADAQELFRDLKTLADQLAAGAGSEGGLQVVQQNVGQMTQAARN